MARGGGEGEGRRAGLDSRGLASLAGLGDVERDDRRGYALSTSRVAGSAMRVRGGDLSMLLLLLRSV